MDNTVQPDDLTPAILELKALKILIQELVAGQGEVIKYLSNASVKQIRM